MSKKKRIELLRGGRIIEGKGYPQGTVIDVLASDADYLVGCGVAAHSKKKPFVPKARATAPEGEEATA